MVLQFWKTGVTGLKLRRIVVDDEWNELKALGRDSISLVDYEIYLYGTFLLFVIPV